eukprot:gene2876-3574_t
MTLVYQGLVDGYQLSYYSNGTGELHLNGQRLWSQGWASDWSYMHFFKCNCKYFLFSYKVGDGTICADTINHQGYITLKRFKIDPGFQSLTYYPYLDGRTDIVVMRKPGKASYFDFDCNTGNLVEYKTDNGCSCPPHPCGPCGTVGAVRAIYNNIVSLRASSEYNGHYSVQHALLNFKTDPNVGPDGDGSESWSARFNDTNQYIMAGGQLPMDFIALQIQGRGDADQWVKSYKIRYTLDNVNWVELNNGQVFNGNYDRNSIVTHTFDYPIRARAMSIHPVSWNNHISLRLELYVRPGSY